MRPLAMIPLLMLVVLLAATATACYTVVDPSAGYAQPIDPTTLGDLSRGEVIEGICPAKVEPVTVASDSRRSNWGHDEELRATAYADRIVLNWVAPDVPGLLGYIVARERNGSNFDDRFQIYRIDEVADIGLEEEYIDSDEIETAEWYNYTVFPVSPGAVGAPSASVTIWTPPDEPPPAPSYVIPGANSDGEIGIGIGFGIHAWKKGIRIARRSAGESAWTIVHEEPPGNGRDHWMDEGHYWADGGVNAKKSHQYAVCVSNANGYGRATVEDSAVEPNEVPVGPPRNFRSVASRDGVTVYWDPLYDDSVTGYEMEMEPCGEDRTLSGLKSNNPRQNFASCGFGQWKPSPVQRTRVRAMANSSPGTWSDYFEVDTSFAVDDELNYSLPELVSLSASYNKVFGVWKTGGTDVDIRYLWNRQDALNDVQYRILRRRAELGSEYEAWDRRIRWVHLDDFDWDEQRSHIDLGWTDNDVRPDTVYEYAVQLRSGDTVHPRSEPKLVRTGPLPTSETRRPIEVRGLKATPTEDGVRLTWESPDDPTLIGLQLIALCDENVGSSCFIEESLLPPDATNYLVLTGSFGPGWRAGGYCFWVRSINDFGLQLTWGERVCIGADEISTCPTSEAEVHRSGGAGYGGAIAISIGACEAPRVQLIRRELTADGFRVKTINEPCAWSTLQIDEDSSIKTWHYLDYDIEPHTWYIYEVRQTHGNRATTVNYVAEITGTSLERFREPTDWCSFPTH